MFQPLITEDYARVEHRARAARRRTRWRAAHRGARTVNLGAVYLTTRGRVVINGDNLDQVTSLLS